VVRVWIDGEKLGEFTELILDEEVWDAAVIDTVPGTVESAASVTYPARATECSE